MRSAVADPAADVRDFVAAVSGVPELEGKIWFHKTAAAVIDAGRCVGCGGCIAACPSRSLEVGTDGHPTLVRMCTGCSACWDYCPLAGFRPEKLAGSGAGELGEILNAWSAHALERPARAQDGGVVTALLAALLEAGEIDGAILTRRVDAFRGEAFLATTPEAVRDAAGSVYHQSHPLELLNRPLPAGIERLAFVGTPCQLTVLRALQRFPWERRKTTAHAVALTVGLFCTRSFDPVALMRSLLARGTNIAEVRKLDVRGGELTASSEGGEELLRAPVKDFRAASLRGCDECADFAALSADIAVGNAGSEPGASTVLVRTHAGARAWEAAAGAFEAAPLDDLVILERAAARNRERAERAMPREFDPKGPLWISYGEHLEAYAPTDRAPVAPPVHRSHHYEVSC
jgi:coenzyme F420 hydrogenase subunit beta